MNIRQKALVAEINKPGPVMIGMLTSNDVAYIQAVKADLIKWVIEQGDSDMGVTWSRHDGALHITS